jgi:ATP-binding cassette subfamily B multidrug efflux pump
MPPSARIPAPRPPPAEPPGAGRITLRVLGFLSPYRPQALAAYGAMIVGTMLALMVPAILGWSVDVALTPVASRTAELVAVPDWLPGEARIEELAMTAGREILLVAAALLVVIALLRGGLGFVEMYLGAWLSQHVAYDVRNRFFRHLQHLSFRFHDRAQSGDLMSRAISDISKVQTFVGEGLLEAVNVPLLFGMVAVVLMRIDPLLALVALSPILLLVVVTLRFGQVIEPRFKAVQDQEGMIGTRAQENFTGMRVVKAFAREGWEVERFTADNNEFLRRRIRAIAAFADFFPTMNAIVVLALVLVVGFGGWQVLAGAISIGTLVSFTFWITLLGAPTQNLGFLVNRGSEAVAAGRRLYEILDTPSDIVEAPGARVLPQLEGRVTFDAVSFAYSDRPVLCDLSFEAAPNQIVALFGPTGCGKSTVVNLIPRFYDVTGGAVRVDGVDVRDVTLESLRRQIAMVLQDTFLFSATIRDNIAYGCLDAAEDTVIAAARAARAHDFILALPEGYDTVIGERGVTLSGGQRQRLAIARALVMQPRILILDDAMSAVDTETEAQIRAALAELMRGRTTFIVAQRLLTLKNADVVLVMDQGRIVERGTHAELIAAGGLYARIYDLQLRDQETLAEAGRAGVSL